MYASALPKWNSVGQLDVVDAVEHRRNPGAVVAHARRWGGGQCDAPSQGAPEAESHHGGLAHDTRLRTERLEGGDTITDRRGRVELAGLFERGGQAFLVVVGLPPGREPPEDVGRADHIAGVGQALGDRPDVRTDPEDLLDQQDRRPRACVRGPDVDRHLAAVTGDLNRSRITHAGHDRTIGERSPARSLVGHAARRLRLRAPAGADRSDADRAS